MTIDNYSSSLAGLLSRIFPQQSLSDFESAFGLAIQHGGLAELDYLRPEGQSYNPAPARIAQIAISDAKLRDRASVIVALLVFVSKNLPQAIVEENFNTQIATLYATCQKSPQQLLQDKDTTAGIIVACAWLDRLRHLHLAPEPTRGTLHETAISQTEDYIELVRDHADSLVVLLKAWKTRASNKRS